MNLEICWIEGAWNGRLAIMPRPRGGDWLEDEVRGWRSAGIDVIVSTLTGEEIAELELGREASLCKANGIGYLAFPVPDRGVPVSVRAVAKLLRQLESKLVEGKNVAIHCRQGLGRSVLLAAGLLILAGADVETALQTVSEARECPVPETAEQREWLLKFSRGLAEHR